jgi:hypothetical protein
VDEDFEKMTREQLIAEARRLRAGIRKHHDSTGLDLCWHHPALWSLLPETTGPVPTVPAGRSFCGAAYGIASRSTSSFRMRRVRMRHTRRAIASAGPASAHAG